PPRRLAMTFDAPGAAPPQGPSRVTFDIEPYHEIVRLTVTHENVADESALEAISAGWPAVFANLKSLLETGHVLPRAPWEMHAELRAAQLAATTGRPGDGAAHHSEAGRQSQVSSSDTSTGTDTGRT